MSTQSDNLPPIPQEWYSENRERFNADFSAIEFKTGASCDHHVIRVSYTEVKCTKCNAGWIDMHRFQIENGKIINVLG